MTALEIVGHWQDTLEDIRTWYPQITDTMYQISSRPLDLSGIRATAEPPLPGGDALVITAAWASDATHTDDTPHPAQIIIESAEAIDRYQGHAEQQYTFATAWERNYQAVSWLHANGYIDRWGKGINAAHHRLQSLIGDEPSKPQPEPEDITQTGHLIPSEVMLTRTEAEHFWPDALDNTSWAMIRKRTQRARQRGEEIPYGKYPVDWIRDTMEQATCA